MYHSINFGSKNTWDDWHLVPTSRPVFNPPALKERKLEIPGGNGIIDMTTSLTGYPVFQNREGSFEFIVMNDYMEWHELYSEISDYLHGQKMKAWFDFEWNSNGYYYEGRFKVNSWKSDKNYSKITIDYSVFPYKIGWLSKSMNIPSTVQQGSPVAIPGELIGQMPVCPYLIVHTTSSDPMIINFTNSYLGINYSTMLHAGSYRIPDIVFYGDDCKFDISGVAGILNIGWFYGRL